MNNPTMLYFKSKNPFPAERFLIHSQYFESRVVLMSDPLRTLKLTLTKLLKHQAPRSPNLKVLLGDFLICYTN